MRARIKAIRSSFNLILSVIEFSVAVRFIMGLFGSRDSWLRKDIGEIVNWIESGSSTISFGIDIRGPATVLVLVLGFMLFSMGLFTIVPKIVEKREREIEFEKNRFELEN